VRLHPHVRSALAVACFAVAGGLGAHALAASRQVAEAPTETATPAVEVRLEGRPLLDPRALPALVDAWESAELTLTLPGLEPRERTRAAFGARVDRARLEALAAAALDPDSGLRRSWPGEGPIDLSMPFDLDAAPLFEELVELREDFNRRPVDARVDLRAGAILPHGDGRLLDVDGTLLAVRRALRRGDRRVDAAVLALPAHRSAEDLADLELDHVLASFETRYSLAATARDRTFNLRVAAAKVDGHVLLPGEELDFNALVGARSEANGFRPAPVIAQGELVDGVGGGTCQIAGTLHAAAFFAGLPILERGPHSRPSTYIYMGLDAVVAYPNLNLRFRNDLEVPIAIGMTVEDGFVRAELRGPPQRRLVTFVRRIDEVSTYPEREVEDGDLPSGVRVLSQRGVPGFRIRTWRILRDTATGQARRTHQEDRYPPTTQIWRVGTGGEAPEGYTPPAGDEHPEYTADAYLSVSQGDGVRGQQVSRRAGDTGRPGYTERLGFPSASPDGE
jgi:vancomycin resistance protein YoaR